MKYLELIYENKIGSAYSLDGNNNAIQIHIGDFAIMMVNKDMPNFLKVIQSTKEENCCSNCKKIIKCETNHAIIKIKTTPSLIEGLEELVLAIMCNYQFETILKNNNIM